MAFNSYPFLLLFLPAVLFLFYRLRSRRARLGMLILSGLTFYGLTALPAVPILLGQGVGTFWYARMLGKPTRPSRWLLALGIAGELALLAAFKYLPGLTFFSSASLLQVIVPIGLSFSTFQMISYLVDAWRGTVPAEPHLLPFLAYVTLFPNLRSGPILRYRDFRPQLDHLGQPAPPDLLHRGILLLILGLAQKVLIADQLGGFVDQLWQHPETLGALAAWVATIGYGLQLLFDFSGYSDMAIGMAGLLGLRLPQNFDSPYQSVSPSDFWRRWHMSLGDWIRDYLYFPLGGSRAGLLRTMGNLLLAMTLVGIWHGTHITFALWGAYHGALLAGYHLLRAPYDRLPIALRRAITLIAVLLGWVIFRAPSATAAREMYRALFSFPLGNLPAASGFFWLTGVVAFVLSVFVPNVYRISFSTKKRLAFALAVILTACLVAMNYQQTAFVYYQF